MTATQANTSYNPYALIAEVEQLLRGKGLDPKTPSERQLVEASIGASKLLHAYGIFPALELPDVIDRTIERH